MIKQITVLEAQDRSLHKLPMYEDVRKLWRDCEFGNDNYYYRYNKEDDEESDFAATYPDLYKYLEQNDIVECLIHWWW